MNVHIRCKFDALVMFKEENIRVLIIKVSTRVHSIFVELSVEFAQTAIETRLLPLS